MKASELAAKLQRLVERHGDLDVCGYFDAGYGCSTPHAFWFTDQYDGPHIAIEVSEGHAPLWKWRLPEDQWPPVDERVDG